MSKQMLKCFHTQNLMMSLWKGLYCLIASTLPPPNLEFLSRDNSMRCFKRIKGKVFIGLTNKLFNGIKSVEECEQKCQGYDGFKCRSAAFYVNEKVGLFKEIPNDLCHRNAF